MSESALRRIKKFNAWVEPNSQEPEIVGEKTLAVTYNGIQEYRTVLSPAEAHVVVHVLVQSFKIEMGAPRIVAEIRRRAARFLCESVGGPAEFARKTGMTNSHISQLLGDNYTKNIGDTIARRFESAFGKPTGWLDVALPPDPPTSIPALMAETERAIPIDDDLTRVENVERIARHLASLSDERLAALGVVLGIKL